VRGKRASRFGGDAGQGALEVHDADNASIIFAGATLAVAAYSAKCQVTKIN
jgi:hypothetical protein